MVIHSSGAKNIKTPKTGIKVTNGTARTKVSTKPLNQKSQTIPDAESLLQRIESLEKKLEILEDTILKGYNLPDLQEENKNLEALLDLTSNTDPVLAELWDNEKDAAYDRL